MPSPLEPVPGAAQPKLNVRKLLDTTRCCTSAAAVGDRGGARGGLAGRRGGDRWDGSPDAAGLGDPIQRAGAGWSHQHSLPGRAAQARRYAQGLPRPDRGGGPDSGSPRRGALAGLRSDHAIARGVWILGVGRHDLSRAEGPGLLACERQTEAMDAFKRTSPSAWRTSARNSRRARR